MTEDGPTKPPAIIEDIAPSVAPYDAREYDAAELIAKDPALSNDQVAELVGLPDGAAVVAAMKRPQIRAYLVQYLDDAGADLQASARVIADAHHAIKKHVVSYMGEATIVEAGPDHDTRLKAAELNLKAHGELKGDQNNVNLFSGLTDQQLAAIASGQLDPATLVDFGPRIQNPAIERPAPPAP